MKRVYYLTPNVQSAETIADELRSDGIKDWRVHVMGEDEGELQRHHVNVAHMFMQRDIIHSAEQGALVGMLLGFVAAVLLMLFPPKGIVLGMLSMAVISLVGAGFGAWVGGLLGAGRENYKIQRFHDDLQQGKYLVMVDSNDNIQRRVSELVQRQHPEAVKAGEGSVLDNPFVLKEAA